jgi:hypothetical protein
MLNNQLNFIADENTKQIDNTTKKLPVKNWIRILYFEFWDWWVAKLKKENEKSHEKHCLRK